MFEKLSCFALKFSIEVRTTKELPASHNIERCEHASSVSVSVFTQGGTGVGPGVNPADLETGRGGGGVKPTREFGPLGPYPIANMDPLRICPPLPLTSLFLLQVKISFF